ncbi:MAG: hypothetical protein DRO88_11400 [Promethearchaeia archaeon]|nr:MAG: hypothetical protein DRO88_11400 [Candidatus Lokiarchaeia archaeon]
MNKKGIIVGDSIENLINSESSPEKTQIESSEVLNGFTPLTEIPLTEYALEKMYVMAEEVTNLTENQVEVYALAVGNNHIIEDVLIPRQTVHYAFVNVETDAILQLTSYIRTNHITVLGWTHSHGNLAVFFSGTDYSNQHTILSETSNFRFWNGIQVKYAYGMTVNLQRNRFGIVSTQVFTGKIFHEPADFRILPTPFDWDEHEIRRKIREELKTKIHFESKKLEKKRKKYDIRKI